MQYRKLRVIISGGGTGGHIFPALSIAGCLKSLNPETEILFVGAKGRMEMEKVPAAGYKIVGLEISGLRRSLSLENLKLPFRLLSSIRKAKRLIREFRPDIAIGVGGYASAPLLRAAQSLGVPTLIQEQNGFAGLANKMLARKAGRICVAYEGMERFFPADRIVLTGNPIRSEIVPADGKMREEALNFYGLDGSRRQLLIVGGSLGSRTLNQAMQKWISEGCPGGENVEIMWQCGKYYKQETDSFMQGRELPHIHYSDFIARMDLAYAAADVVVSRSGASSISELCAAHKACIFVPSPNVTEDHQTHNAEAFRAIGAALLCPNDRFDVSYLEANLDALRDPAYRAEMGRLAKTLAKPKAAEDIVSVLRSIID